MYACVSKAIIWTNAGILLIGLLGTNLSEILIEIHKFSPKNMYSKMLSEKWRPFYLGLNVLMWLYCNIDESRYDDYDDIIVLYHDHDHDHHLLWWT